MFHNIYSLALQIPRILHGLLYCRHCELRFYTTKFLFQHVPEILSICLRCAWCLFWHLLRRLRGSCRECKFSYWVLNSPHQSSKHIVNFQRNQRSCLHLQWIFYDIIIFYCPMCVLSLACPLQDRANRLKFRSKRHIDWAYVVLHLPCSCCTQLVLVLSLSQSSYQDA